MIGRATVVAGCLYEVAAIVTGRAPTITALVHRLGRYRFGRFLVWLALGYIVDHFIEKEISA